jgi:hypothetical protein
MPNQRQVTYTDELLSDDTVHRTYSDDRQEWRRRTAAGTVEWQDHRGNAGTDEPLGRRLVKRTYRDGTVIYGRELGYGRTLWGDGVLTSNRSKFGGRLGIILAAVAGGALLGGLAMPPQSMTPAQEDELRTEALTQQSYSGGGTGGDSSTSFDGWSDAGDGDCFADGCDFG